MSIEWNGSFQSHIDFHSAARNENQTNLEGLMDHKEVKKMILLYPESAELPENIIENITKIALQQGKYNKSAWIIKMLADAKKKYDQALIAKKIKNQNIENFEDNKVITKKLHQKKVMFFKKDELEHLLPYVKDLRSYYPKLSNITWNYILENYSQWPLIVMAIFPQRDRLFPQWTVQCAATLSNIGLKKILDLNLEKNPDELYKYLKKCGNFKKHYNHRNKYISFIRKFRFIKDEKENNSSEMKNTSKDIDNR